MMPRYLVFSLCLLACADEETPEGWLRFAGRSYESPTVQARVLKISSGGYDLRLRVVTEGEYRVSDSEVLARVDAHAPFLLPDEYPFSGESLLPAIEDPVATTDLDVGFSCSLSATQPWKSDLLEPACVRVFTHASGLSSAFTERVNGILRIDHVTKERVAGSLQMWAVALYSADTEWPLEETLFASGIEFEVPFSADIER
jgi:hypothetical protein